MNRPLWLAKMSAKANASGISPPAEVVADISAVVRKSANLDRCLSAGSLHSGGQVPVAHTQALVAEAGRAARPRPGNVDQCHRGLPDVQGLDNDTIKLCRIQYLGDDDEWAFAIWQASTDSYADAVLLDASFTGHPSQALDTVCTLYLADIGDQPP
jgi:hypothetical protein